MMATGPAAAFVRMRRMPWARYGVALLAVGVATAIKLAFPEIGRAVPISLFLAAVMLAAWFGGARPGLVATTLSTLASTYFFVAPYDSFDVATRADVVRLAVGVVEGTVISLLAGALHAARKSAERRAHELTEANEALRTAMDARARAESSLTETTAQLFHSQKTQSIGVLAGSVAHDFNNLLSVILSYASLVHARLAPRDPLREDVRQIQEASERAATLTRRLLAFARKATLEPRVVDLNGAVRGLEPMLRVLLGETVTLVVATSEAPAPILADPTHLEQLVTNLAVNARDAMPEGGRLTIVIANVQVAGADHVELRVADTGAGMAADVAARIFEPFFTTKEAGRGSGLGLAIVSSVVRHAGGTIAVESVPGAGTTFTVHLPKATGAIPPAEEAREWTPPAPRRERILVVEDDDAVRRSTVAALGALGYAVVEAANGEAALEAFRREGDAIDLVVSDVVMPGMSGVALARRLALLRASARVVLVSGYAADAAFVGEPPAGVRVVQKPLTPRVLDEAVRAALE